MAATAIIGHARRPGRCTNRRRIRGRLGLLRDVAGGTFRCCFGCAVRQGWVVAEYIRQGLEGLAEGTWVGFLTITEPSEARSVEEHAQAVSRFLEWLWTWLEARYGVPGPLPYTGVREFQKRGAVHTHVLIIGWPKVDLAYLDHIAKSRFGLGHTSLRGTFRIGWGWQRLGGRLLRVDNVAAYLAKVFSRYLAKGSDLWAEYCELMPKGYRQLHHGGGWPSTLTAIREARKARSPRQVVRDRIDAKILDMWRATDLLRSMLGAEFVVPQRFPT